MMKKIKFKITIAGIVVIFSLQINAQDTFSIVAADSSSREVGSAGASCVDLFSTAFTDDFLGDLFPNKGAINSQASYIATNQINARNRMNAGDTPAQIINWLTAYDAGGDPTKRQYGIVGFVGNNVSAKAYTGVNCTDYKNHVTGSIAGIHYSIQGNILLGQKVLDSMESRFRNAKGDLACKLMAALQGAKMVGADTRCAPNGTSTLFAFVKVVQPTDVYGSPSFLVSVRTHNNAQIEPIDTLQKKFNDIHSCIPLAVKNMGDNFDHIKIFPNPANDKLIIESGENFIESMFNISDQLGKIILNGKITNEIIVVNISELKKGVYFFQVGNFEKQTFKVLKE